MNAKQRNDSLRKLFLYGGRLDILFMDEPETEEQVPPFRLPPPDLITECPCGCGLKNDICAARRKAVRDINDEIPF